MEVYDVRWKHSAIKELRKLESTVRKKILDVVGHLSKEPRPDGCKKIKGSLQTYRIRVSDFRVVYEVDKKTQVVIVVRVRHRREVYK
jgi:mRNA interferase RelE/StbE